ncbi:MAG: MerR family transcriptional regulator [Leptolyngbya sp. SIOISBB]|nr:MerR family transcriptional regulator [Leptolyngbya sp. SIOISBB]
MQHFTRRETVILTRTSLTRLAYLARTGVIVPMTNDEDAVRQVYYTWEQILELRAIRLLRRQVSLQMIRKILAFLEGTGCGALHDKHLVIKDGEVHWVQPQANMEPQVVQVAAKANCHVGQLNLMTLPSLMNLADEIWETARSSNVIDFESFRQRVVPFRPR